MQSKSLVAHALVLIIGLGGASGAFAQELEEIQVTATRRQEIEQNVPISITALTSNDLQAARIEGVRDLQFTTPGLEIANRSVAFVPYIPSRRRLWTRRSGTATTTPFRANCTPRRG